MSIDLPTMTDAQQAALERLTGRYPAPCKVDVMMSEGTLLGLPRGWASFALSYGDRVLAGGISPEGRVHT